MKNLQIIKVKYLGATNTQPSRVKLTDLKFNKSKTIPFDYSQNNSSDMAIKYLESIGYQIHGRAYDDDFGYIVLDASDNSFNRLY